jgi:hypothetical protein
VADVHGNGIGALLSGILIPLDEELYFGKDAFVTA